MDSGLRACSLISIDSATARAESASYGGLFVFVRAIARTYQAVPQRGVSIELERLQQPTSHSRTSSVTTPVDTADLERSRPSSPAPESVQVVPSVWDPHKNRLRFLAVCLMNFGNGMNDSAPGALIPYMEKYASHSVRSHYVPAHLPILR